MRTSAVPGTTSESGEMRASTISRPETGERRLRRAVRPCAAVRRARAISASDLKEASTDAASTPASNARWWRSSSAAVSSTRRRASARSASASWLEMRASTSPSRTSAPDSSPPAKRAG